MGRPARTTTRRKITVGPGYLEADGHVPVHREITASWSLCGPRCERQYLVREVLAGRAAIVAVAGATIAGSVLLADGTVVTFGPARSRTGDPSRCAWCEERPVGSPRPRPARWT